MYLSILLRAVLGLNPNNLTTRRLAYEETASALSRVLADGGFDEIEVALQEQLLTLAIRQVEADIRNGVDITSPDYYPTALAEAEYRAKERAALLRKKSGAANLGGEPDPSIVKRAASVMERLKVLDQLSAFSCGAADRPSRISVIYALLIRSIHNIAADSKIAIVWVVLEPAFLIAFIVAMYWLVGSHQIMNMDIAPFAVTGSVSWGLLRASSVRVGSAMLRARDVLNLPPVSPFDVAMTEALVSLLIYSGVFVVAIGFVLVLGLGDPPDDLLNVVKYWLGLWVAATGVGLMFSYFFLHWSYGKRIIPVAWRGVSLVSGVLFVSEQFPEDVKGYLLMNPILHGIQLMRDAYFAGYKTVEASALYFFCSAVLMLMVGMACERRSRRMIAPG